MGFSILTLAVLRDHLPDVDWAPLLTSLGYATGFVILGRQQLFTVNTATVALPVIAGRSWRALGRTGLFALLANARVEDEVRAVDPDDDEPPAGPGYDHGFCPGEWARRVLTPARPRRLDGSRLRCEAPTAPDMGPR